MRVVEKQIALSPQAAVHYESNAFADKHPEFVRCQQNAKAMLGYIEQNKLPMTVDSFEKAYEHLRNERKLFVPNGTSFAQMTAAEVRQLAQEHGIPRYDHRGQIVGYDWPENFYKLPPVETEDSPRLRQKSQMSHPGDYGKKPTKREFAMWDSTRQREWSESNGTWGHALPEYLR
jgi:hypothetical protein